MGTDFRIIMEASIQDPLKTKAIVFHLDHTALSLLRLGWHLSECWQGVRESTLLNQFSLTNLPGSPMGHFRCVLLGLPESVHSASSKGG